MMQSPEIGRRKVLKAVRLAERLGCKYIGLGAFTSIVTDGGLYLKDKVKIALTTGNAYAAALVIENLFKVAEKISVRLKDSSLAIVGAAGSVGSACSKILSSKVKKTMLIDKRNEELRNLIDEIGEDNKNIEFYYDLPQPINANFIVTVTSSAEGIIRSQHLRPGTIIIDAAQPYNVSNEVIRNREDVLVINSGVATLEGIKLNMDVGLNKEEVYACLGETLILSWRGWKGHYSLGDVEPSHVEEILDFAPKLGLRVREFRNSKGGIKEEDLLRIKEIAGR